MLVNRFKSIILICFILSVTFINCQDDEDDNDIKPTETPKNLVTYSTPQPPKDKVFLYDSFDDENKSLKKWIKSKSTKADSTESKYDGTWEIVSTNDRIPGDYGLMIKDKARHHAISAKLDKPFDFKGSDLIVQYDVQFRNGQECGGAYIKLLVAPTKDLGKIHDKTPYSIMFGPDKCGQEHKLHFIFNHKNKKNGALREIHWKKASSADGLNEAIGDKKWHVFRLTIRQDNTYEISIDRKVVGKGSLLEDFNPAVNPPKEIDDPKDKKPEDWDEREKVPDPKAVKPDDWDENEPRKIPDSSAIMPSDWLEEESEMIPDETAKKPDDWSEEMDGDWEPPLINNPKCSSVSGCGQWKAPLVDNPKYKGKWKPPLIANPNYKGKWAPRKIPNPDYFEDLTPYKMQTIDAAAFELWTISNEIVFDNVLITSDSSVADMIVDTAFQPKRDLNDENSDSWYMNFIRSTNKQPWMWGVYVLLLVVPVALFIGYCTYSKPSAPRQTTSQTQNEPSSSELEQEESQQSSTRSGGDQLPSGVKDYATEEDASEEENNEDADDGEETETEEIEASPEDLDDEDED